MTKLIIMPSECTKQQRNKKHFKIFSDILCRKKPDYEKDTDVSKLCSATLPHASLSIKSSVFFPGKDTVNLNCLQISY